MFKERPYVKDSNTTAHWFAVSFIGRAVAQEVSRRLEPGASHVGPAVDRATLGQVSSEYFGPSVSMSWCRAPSGAHDQIVINCLTVAVPSRSCALSDERSGLSFVSHSPKSWSTCT
jgi:hypothetical protein